MSPPARRNEKRKGKGEDAILEKKLMPAARVLPDPVRKHFGVSQFCQAMTPFLAFQDLMRYTTSMMGSLEKSCVLQS